MPTHVWNGNGVSGVLVPEHAQLEQLQPELDPQLDVVVLFCQMAIHVLMLVVQQTWMIVQLIQVGCSENLYIF